jgi:GNAT superfamily N-acetyltransferase
MLQVLDTRHDLTCYVATSVHDLPWAELLVLLDDAWGADYRNQSRMALDEPFLRRLMADHSVWVACLLYTQAHQLLGFELALERTLYWHGDALPVYYPRLFTIHQHYRRRGYGRWLLHCINRLLFEERGAALAFVAFHAGHAGLPTVQQTHAVLPDWGLQCFSTAPVWGCRLDRLPPPETAVLATRLAVQPDGLLWPESSGVETAVSSPLSSLEAFRTALRKYDVAFDPGENFGAQYLRGDTPDAGTYGYHFRDEAVCSLSYDMVTLLENERCLGRLGRIQTVYARHCHPSQLAQALQHICQVFARHGCVFAGLFDLGDLPHHVLRALSFRPLGTESIVTVRGPRAVIEALAPVQPPFFVDI